MYLHELTLYLEKNLSYICPKVYVWSPWYGRDVGLNGGKGRRDLDGTLLTDKARGRF